jgi:hypothetical protein
MSTSGEKPGSRAIKVQGLKMICLSEERSDEESLMILSMMCLCWYRWILATGILPLRSAQGQNDKIHKGSYQYQNPAFSCIFRFFRVLFCYR